MPTRADASVQLQTRSGYIFWVNPVTIRDAGALKDFSEQVSGDDLRFRFLTFARKTDAQQIEQFGAVEQALSESFVAYDLKRSTVIASAVLITDASGLRAEAALAIHSNFKNMGISWTLLKHIAQYAKNRGVKILSSIERREHHNAMDIDREPGFVARPVTDEASLVELTGDLNS